MKATLIDQPALRLITAKSKHFPEGNTAAFHALESNLPSLKGRRFYGIAYRTDQGMDYYAGLVPDGEAEELEFARLGFPVLEIDGGPCARFKLMDWQDKIEQIAPTFGAMIEDYGIDPSRPQMEFYRSTRELHLLLPVSS